MGKYCKFKEYNASEIQWITECPKGWSVSRIKFFAELNPSKSELKHLPADLEVTFLPMEAIGDNGEVDVSRKKPLAEVLSGFTYLAEGDVCIAKITPCFENGKGAVVSGLCNSIGFATTEVIPLRCTRGEDRNYLYYLLMSEPFRFLAEGSMYGAGGQKRVADSFVANFHFSLPPENERQKIAEFLDYETAKIDKLIEKQQQLIELLKEKRQAVISHAVTKGLNPDAPMKDSGVEWLGEVPEHWFVTPLKYLVSAPIIDGPHVSPEKRDSGVPFISAEAISGGTIDFDKKWGYISQEDHELYSKRYKPLAGDILMVKLGATTGAVAFVDTTDDFNVWVPLATIRIVKTLPSKYFFYLFQSIQFRSAVELGWTYGTQQTLGLGTLENFRIPTPTPSECASIVNELESKLPKLDSIIEKAKLYVEIVKERRTALTSAAVTGKIDVRDWQPPTQERDSAA